MRFQFVSLLVAVGGLHLLAAPAAAAVTLTPSQSPVQLGSTVVFTLATDELDDLIAFDFDLSYDSARLEFLDAAPTLNLPGAEDSNNYFLIDFGPGAQFINFAGSLGSSGPGEVLSLSFKAIGLGFADAAVDGIYYQDMSALDVPLSAAGQVEITAGDRVVPEPETWLMMIVGFGAVGATLRRRRSSGKGWIAITSHIA